MKVKRPKTMNEGAGIQRRYFNKKLGRMQRTRYPFLNFPKDIQNSIRLHIDQIIEIAYNQGKEDYKLELEKFTAEEKKRTRGKGGLGIR